MKRAKLLLAMLAVGTAVPAVAGPTIALGVPLGNPLGLTLGGTLGLPLGSLLGHVLGAPLGVPFGDVLPLASSALFVVAAASLGLGIYVVRRKRHR